MLEDMLGLAADLQRARDCLQLLIGPPESLGGAGLLGAALYTQALVSYVRCFASGRRHFLKRDIFANHPELVAEHDRAKATRDRHISHSVDELEHVNVLVAAESPDSAALGLGVRYWFFVRDEIDGLKRMLELVKFVDSHVADEIERLGDRVATDIMGSPTSWADANKRFALALSFDDPVYGPTSPL